VISGGLIGGKFASADQVRSLTDMPSREVLLAQVVGGIQAPVSAFVGVLAASVRGIMNVLNAAPSSWAVATRRRRRPSLRLVGRLRIVDVIGITAGPGYARCRPAPAPDRWASSIIEIASREELL
jgi:hypothetical protein